MPSAKGNALCKRNVISLREAVENQGSKHSVYSTFPSQKEPFKGGFQGSLGSGLTYALHVVPNCNTYSLITNAIKCAKAHPIIAYKLKKKEQTR